MFNSCTFLGNLAEDIKIQEGEKGAFGVLRFAVNNKRGEYENTMWFSCFVNHNLEMFQERCKKGTRVLVSGSLDAALNDGYLNLTVNSANVRILD